MPIIPLFRVLWSHTGLVHIRVVIYNIAVSGLGLRARLFFAILKSVYSGYHLVIKLELFFNTPELFEGPLEV